VQGPYFLGVDGGGSKIALALAGASGHVLARHRGPGSVFEGRPQPAQCRMLAKLIRETCKRAGIRLSQLSLAGLGLSGIDHDDEMPMQRRVIAKATGIPEKRMLLVNDGVAALGGASPEPALVMLQFGTEFTAAWRPAYGRERCFDNLSVGRPFDIRWSLVALVARMIDGREKATPLKRLALKHYGVDGKNFCRAIYEKRVPQALLRSTPPLVFQAWQRGDTGATKLVDGLAEDMALAAKVMRQKCGRGPVATALGGGVLSRGSGALLKLVAKKLKAPVISPALAPELGALVMSAHAAGLQPRNYFRSLT